MTHLTTVIPVYNGEAHLAHTLRSVAGQSRRPDRLVVLDNGSTDGTRRIVESFADMPCEWRQNESNLGLFGNLNRALQFAAQTECLHILHADDVLKPGYYQRLTRVLEPVRSRGLAYCRSEFIDESGLPLGAPARESVGRPRRVAAREFLRARGELRPFYFPAVLLKTDGQPAPCAFRTDMPQLADIVFWAEWATHSDRIVELPEVLCQYRVHPGADTRRNQSSLQAWVLDEWKAMELIAGLGGERGAGRWLWKQKLRCVFAARSGVKIRAVRETQPAFAMEIERATRAIAGTAPWALGKFAVCLRDIFRYGRRP